MATVATELGILTFDGFDFLSDNDTTKAEIIRAITEERLDRIEQANRQRK